jgi:hypothetical protein
MKYTKPTLAMQVASVVYIVFIAFLLVVAMLSLVSCADVVINNDATTSTPPKPSSTPCLDKLMKVMP